MKDKLPETDIAICPHCGFELIVKLSDLYAINGIDIKHYVFPTHYRPDYQAGGLCIGGDTLAYPDEVQKLVSTASKV